MFPNALLGSTATNVYVDASVIAMVKALPDLSHPMTFSKKLTEKHAQVMSIAFTVMSLLSK